MTGSRRVASVLRFRARRRAALLRLVVPHERLHWYTRQYRLVHLRLRHRARPAGFRGLTGNQRHLLAQHRRALHRLRVRRLLLPYLCVVSRLTFPCAESPLLPASSVRTPLSRAPSRSAHSQAPSPSSRCSGWVSCPSSSSSRRAPRRV